MKDAVNEVSAAQCTPNMMTAAGTAQRDHVVTFCEANSWLAASDCNVPAAQFEVIRACYGNEHYPVFFFFEAQFTLPGSKPCGEPHELGPPGTATTRAGTFKEMQGLSHAVAEIKRASPDVETTELPALPLHMRAKSSQSSSPRTDTDIFSLRPPPGVFFSLSFRSK